MKRLITFIAALFFMPLAFALIFAAPKPNEAVIGALQTIHSQKGDNLQKIARRYEMGYKAMRLANPKVRSRGRLKPNTSIVLPGMFILPDTPRAGIIVNVAELRLYYFPPASNIVVTEPIAVGRPGWSTPLMEAAKIVEKIKDPAWTVPKSIWNYNAAKGIYLPKVVPPGPNNPLGQYALRLSMRSILIHGTNQPILIGKRVSSGCIRMYPEDIEHLFYRVPLNAPVQIVNQPYKVGWKDNKLYLEVHPAFKEKRGSLSEERTKMHERILKAVHGNMARINCNVVDKIQKQTSGIPGIISQ